jgi:uncharacterized BrkB/YihY/UPF0761 family membrane protein
MRRTVDDLRGWALAIFRRAVALRLAQVAANLAFLSLLAIVPVVSLAFSVPGCTGRCSAAATMRRRS